MVLMQTQGPIDPYLDPDNTIIDPEAIVAARHARGMTQEQLAAHLDYSCAAVRAWEAMTRNPNPRAVKALARFIRSVNRERARAATVPLVRV